MKVLGLSFGRKMQNCEILVKQALRGAEASGAEVNFLRTINLRVDHCIACGACSSGMRAGKQIECCLKDDYHIIEEAILDSDAVLVAAPVYALAPTGQYKNFMDRFGPSHDRMALEAERDKRAEAGTEPLDERCLRRRYIAYISVGGAHTQNWVSYGLVGMHLLGFSTWMKAVGHIDAYNMGYTGSPILDKDLMDRAFALGVHIATANEDTDWFGEPGICPVCHLSHITLDGTTTVECPFCGISGTLIVEGDKVCVDFPPEQQARSRYTREGLQEHYLEIQSMGPVAAPKIEANKAMLEEELKKFKTYLA